MRLNTRLALVGKPKNLIDRSTTTQHKKRQGKKIRAMSVPSLVFVYAPLLLTQLALSSCFAMSTPSKTFYKRVLPSSCTAFSSKRGKEIFASALRNHGLKSYFALMEQHTTQTEPSFCGISTLVVVLNAFSIDPKQSWKGPWRWYHEGILNCCLDLDEVKNRGITFPDFACLAICQGLSVDIRYAQSEEGSVEAFRAAVRKACVEDISSELAGRENASVGTSLGPARNAENIVNGDDEEELRLRDLLVVSYDRKTLGQTGSGHFSPLAAYDSESDSVLILDTARFKYGAHWIPLPLLHSAMIPKDNATGKSRGFAMLSLRDDELESGLPLQDQLPVSTLFRYKFDEEARRHRYDFYEFIKSRRPHSLTWQEVYEYWTKDGSDPSFVWQMMEPQFKPQDEATRIVVDDVIDAVQKILPHSADEKENELGAEGKCRRTCRPNHSRTLPLRPEEAIFIVFLSVLDTEKRLRYVSRALSEAGSEMGPAEDQLLAVAHLVGKFIELA